MTKRLVTAGMSQPGAGDRHFTSSEIDEQTMMVYISCHSRGPLRLACSV